ncbi:hypothetical protein LDENG_00044130 [Lucifuga dentata]|nr:hypothetical protein LDENG_00044130 [Lucifuga dentata]
MGAHGNRRKHLSSTFSSSSSSRLCSTAKAAKMASVAHIADKYYEKIASIQQSMHKREKRRLELERELCAYSRSDKRISQIKCSKLRSYLKGICDREAQAKMRNLELLRDVECIEISMKNYSPDHGPLQQQKADCLNKISTFMAARNRKQELDVTKVDIEPAHRNQDSSLYHPPKNFRQPTDFRVGGEDAASKRAHLSDDISGSNNSPDGCNLSDKRESTMAALPSVRALTGAAGNAPFGGDDEQTPSPPVTLMEPEKNLLSPSSSRPRGAKNSPAEHAKTGENVHQLPVMKEAERDHNHLGPEKPFGKESQDTTGRCESVSPPSSGLKLSVSSASDLSLSLTQSESEDDLPKDVACKYPDATVKVAPERSTTSGGSDNHSQHSPELSLHSEGSKNGLQLSCDSSASEVTTPRLSQEGLFNLLDNIEGQLQAEQTCIYRDSSIEGNQLNRIISLCNSGSSFNDEDIGACGAVVLHELQKLSWSTTNGCLLPQDLVNARQSSTEPKDISASLPPDAAQLWDRWFKHTLLLKEHRVLSTERLVQLFTPLLLERHATDSHQAKMLLRTLLAQSSEKCPSQDENDLSSSCDHSSFPADGGGMEPARPVQHNQHNQELQSTEEDSQDESPVESIPIRETKAYQLLKQSAMQKRLQSSEEEDENDLSDKPGINQEHEEDLGRAKLSSHQDPYPRKGKISSKPHSILQSKAFCGESDDSNSEIEAALRPQPFSRNNDDSDDFD